MRGFLDRYLAIGRNWFGPKDGMGFRVAKHEDLPTCTEALRRVEYAVEGGAGIADQHVVCHKDDSDLYDWLDVATLTGPQGPQGPQGATGATGATGPTGSAGNGITAATTTVAAYARLNEATNNGSNYVDVTAPTSLGSNYTQTLPAATGTIALAPTITSRSTTNASITNGSVVAITATCNANEVCTGGGYTNNTNTVGMWVYVNNKTTNGWTISVNNQTGAPISATVYAVCAQFGA